MTVKGEGASAGMANAQRPKCLRVFTFLKILPPEAADRFKKR